MKIFRVNLDLKSYTYPILKILICILVIIFAVNSSDFFILDNKIVYFFVRFVSVVLVIGCVLCIYISFAEILMIHDKHTKIFPQGVKSFKEIYNRRNNVNG